MNAGTFHIPVMLSEVLAWLKPESGLRYIDATVGGGGHAEAILEESSPDGLLLGIDRDEEALRSTRTRLHKFGRRAVLVHSDFDRISEVAKEKGFDNVHGIVADLGVSSRHLDAGDRGFSFMKDGPLDMRMNLSATKTAASILEQISEKELADIIFNYGEERYSRRIARYICRAREKKPIKTTSELAALVAEAVPRRGGKIHPATRTFQALRILVNDELGMLDRFLKQAPDLLCIGGRLVVISYHSLEDRKVKNSFRELAGLFGKVLTKKVIFPSREEIAKNTRARSAKLRVFERAG